MDWAKKIDLKERVLGSLLISTAFVVFGFYGVRFWQSQLGASVFYTVESPVIIEFAKYKPCDTVRIFLVRHSTIDSQGQSSRQLLFLTTDQGEEVKGRQDVPVTIDPGTKQIITTFNLPCDLPEGNYYIRATIEFTVDGFEKFAPWHTQTFTISKNGQ